MKKKIIFKHSSLVYTTDLDSTTIEENGSINWQSYCFINNIKIDKKDNVCEVLYKLLRTALMQILESGLIYVKLYLNTDNIDLLDLDDYKLIILGLGFEQISKSNEGIMFSFGGD